MPEEDKQILVIDDDDVVRQSIVAYLEDSGFSVKEAPDGRTGIDLLKSSSPSIVITDLRMPDVDGLQVLKTIRNWKPELPVIVVSGMGVVRDVVDALRLGAVDYLVKPLVDMEVLVHAINRILEREGLREQNVGYRSELEKANRELREAVRVLERDQKAGRRVQTKFLPPRNVSFGGYKLDFDLIPSLYLSGDLVDYGFIADRYLAFYLADVSGHGAAPAFVTIWLKQLVRSYFRNESFFQDPTAHDTDVSRILSSINKEVLNSDLECHLTCFVGVIDSHTNKMQYAVGGHLPFPILIDKGEPQYLIGKGKPLGIFQDAKWETYSVKLTEGFSLVVFSDGVLEILPESELMDKEIALLDKVKGKDKALKDISRDLGINGVDPVPDDIAILKIQAEKY